jgi:glycosidase
MNAKPDKLLFVLAQAERCYSLPAAMVAQIDNYEKPAFVTAAAPPAVARLRQALAILLTIDRVPLLYTGHEAGLDYRETGTLFGPGAGSPEMLDWTRTLITLRRREPALRRGRLADVQADGPMIAFTRVDGSSRVLVAVNASDTPRKMMPRLEGPPQPAVALHDLLADSKRKPVIQGGAVELPPYGVRIFRVSGAMGAGH